MEGMSERNMNTLGFCRPLVALTLAVLLISGARGDVAKVLPMECRTDCVAPYGTVLGATRRGIEAYSNCNSDCVIFDPNRWNGTYTGIKWQCVEYARRWLLQNKGAVYGDVDVAADIWEKIDHLVEVGTQKKLPLESRLNGAEQPPRPGDLLIYAKAFNNTGHVAVVVDVDHEAGHIKVAEQNFRNQPWLNDYARKVELLERSGRYWLLDAYLLGWKHLLSEELAK